MDNFFHKESEIALAAAFCMLLVLHYDAEDGVTTVGEIADYVAKQKPKPSEEHLDEDLTRTAFLRMAQDNAPLRETLVVCQSRTMGYDAEGLNAALFKSRYGEMVAYLGTAEGEWSDNAIALLGRPQTNVYYQYDTGGEAVSARIIEERASTQQAQALDFFNRLAAMRGWTQAGSIAVTGHSKGGNKAQFVTLQSPLVRCGYSFCGQGFAPEAVASMRAELGADEFESRAAKIWSLNNHNDFVHVLGDNVAPAHQTVYMECGEHVNVRLYHQLASVVGEDGNLRSIRQRGELTVMAQGLWQELKTMPDREVVSMAVMTACENFLGNGFPINGEFVSRELYRQGGRTAVRMLARSMGASLVRMGVNYISDDDKQKISSFYTRFAKQGAEQFRASLGGVIDRVLAGIKTAPQSEAGRPEVVIGAQENCFSICPDSIRQAAAQLDAVGERFAVLGRSKAERERLTRCRRYLMDTAQDFQSAEAELVQLAGFALF